MIEAQIREAIDKPEGELTKADLEKVTELDLFGGGKISDVSPLAELTQLRKLVLWDNQITDVSPLKGLTQLVELNLQNNQISDISSLCNLKQLVHLNLHENNLSDDQLNHLEGFSELTYLGLGRNKFQRLPDLGKFPKLYELELFQSSFVDLSPVAVCKNLKIIDLRNFGGPNPNVFGALEGLDLEEIKWCGEYDRIREEELLRLSEAYAKRGHSCHFIHDINVESDSKSHSFSSLLDVNAEAVRQATGKEGDELDELLQETVYHYGDWGKATSLNLSYNKIIDVSALAGLTYLEELCLEGTEISDVSALREFEQLEILYLGDNQISDVNPLKELTQLRELYLNYIEITDVSTFAGLTRLKKLNLNGNQISDVSPLKDLTQLTKLELESNQIGDVTPLKDLTQLTWLHLGGNQISDATPLKDLTQLKYLLLWNNPDLTKAQIAELQKALPKCSISHNANK